ncbi:hypothetical protein Tco_0558085 [Tanacetum coccineum]
MFAVCACARFHVTSKVLDLHAVKRIFRYLKGQPKLGFWYPKDSPFDLEAYTDSDYAGASLDRKSTTRVEKLHNNKQKWVKGQEIPLTPNTHSQLVHYLILNQLLFHHYLNPKRLKDLGKPKRATEISQSSGPIPLVANETITKEWEDRMERAATAASSLEAEQYSGNINRTQSMATLNEPLPYGTGSGSGPKCQDTILGGAEAQTRFETASKKSNDPPLSRVNTLRSREDSMKLKELMKLFNAGVSKLMLLSLNLLLPVLVYAARHTLTVVRHNLLLLVAFLSKLEESTGFEEIVDFLNSSHIKYSLTVNPTVYESCIQQFWATAKAKTVNEERQLQSLVDKKKIVITESIIRQDLHLEDAEGTDCLPTATIF